MTHISVNSSSGYNGYYYNNINDWLSSPTDVYTSNGDKHSNCDMIILSVVFGMNHYHMNMSGMKSIDSLEDIILIMAGEFQCDELTHLLLSSLENRAAAKRGDVPSSFS